MLHEHVGRPEHADRLLIGAFTMKCHSAVQFMIDDILPDSVKQRSTAYVVQVNSGKYVECLSKCLECQP